MYDGMAYKWYDYDASAECAQAQLLRRTMKAYDSNVQYTRHWTDIRRYSTACAVIGILRSDAKFLRSAQQLLSLRNEHNE